MLLLYNLISQCLLRNKEICNLEKVIKILVKKIISDILIKFGRRYKKKKKKKLNFIRFCQHTRIFIGAALFVANKIKLGC